MDSCACPQCGVLASRLARVREICLEHYGSFPAVQHYVLAEILNTVDGAARAGLE